MPAPPVGSDPATDNTMKGSRVATDLQYQPVVQPGSRVVPRPARGLRAGRSPPSGGFRMRPSHLARAFVAVLLAASLLVGGGCRSRGGSGCDTCAAPPPCPAPCAAEVATRVMPGDTLHGHLPAAQGCQCFYFDGVEYGLLDYEVVTDCRGGTVPTVSIEGPDGKDLGLEEGPANTKGIVLRKTGTYRVTVCKQPSETEVF